MVNAAGDACAFFQQQPINIIAIPTGNQISLRNCQFYEANKRNSSVHYVTYAI